MKPSFKEEPRGDSVRWIRFVSNPLQRRAFQGFAGSLCALALAAPLLCYAQSVDGPSDKTSLTVRARYNFDLRQGKDVPVCTAFLRRLQRGRYQKPPFCGLPDDDSIPGFQKLDRIYLTAQEVEKLYPKVQAFAKHLGQIGNMPYQPASTALRRLGVNLFAWRYEPAISVENNGRPDNIIVWQGAFLENENGPLIPHCGDVVPIGPHAWAEYGFRVDQEPLVFSDADTEVDERRTEELFGHPNGRVVHGPDRDYKVPGYRPIGEPMDLFAYEGKYYIDAFFGSTSGDFEGQRVGKASLNNTLGVFVRESGKTRQVCEVQMTETLIHP